MFFGDLVEPSFQSYQKRRNELVQIIKKNNPEVKNGLVLFFASFENPNVSFRQESSFYYFSGIEESGVVIAIDMEGKSTLFVPNCVQERKRWMGSAIEPTEQDAKQFCFENIALLGQPIKGIQLYPYFDKNSYENILQVISDCLSNDGKLFVLNPNNTHQYGDQRFVLKRMQSFVPALRDEHVKDISDIVAQMRRKKDIFEIGKISEAINVTALAHDSVARTIEDGALESEVQAAAEYVLTSVCAKTAYPSIVASGSNGTILHYHKNCSAMNKGDLVIVDVGAKFDHYCADITRTYPVSGSFTERQKELYSIVLEAQAYIASLAKPGYFLNNSDQQDKSLTHLARVFLNKKGGYDACFTHGIGHYLGLDVHDVGSLKEPLEEGDVITIEPGLYLPDEGIGIRIEDNYWIKMDKAICLSDMIPKEADQIIQFMKFGLQDSDQIES